VKNFSSRVLYSNTWPSAETFGDDVLLIYDQIFDRHSKVKTWIRKFPHRYAVKSGESLKDLNHFPRHMKMISQKTKSLSSRQLKIVVLGGGSVGDFGGFVASVFKRGVELIQIPSTWLAAMDSAHGGKTALNVAGAKNQIGTFYPATRIHLIKPLLMAQPAERSFEALGEVIKTALLSGGRLFTALNAAKRFDGKNLWSLLPLVVREKYRIVHQDPLETSGHRHLLNFGHTLGHVFESHYRLPHGVAVLAGLQFSLEWSYQRGLMTQREYLKLMHQPFWLKAVAAKLQSPWKKLNMLSLLSEKPAIFMHYLRQDKKKSTAQSLRFIFLRKPGQPLVEVVNLQDFPIEIHRQRSFWG
jgi:3-dehydroquinate synthase